MTIPRAAAINHIFFTKLKAYPELSASDPKMAFISLKIVGHMQGESRNAGGKSKCRGKVEMQGIIEGQWNCRHNKYLRTTLTCLLFTLGSICMSLFSTMLT